MWDLPGGRGASRKPARPQRHPTRASAGRFQLPQTRLEAFSPVQDVGRAPSSSRATPSIPRRPDSIFSPDFAFRRPRKPSDNKSTFSPDFDVRRLPQARLQAFSRRLQASSFRTTIAVLKIAISLSLRIRATADHPLAPTLAFGGACDLRICGEDSMSCARTLRPAASTRRPAASPWALRTRAAPDFESESRGCVLRYADRPLLFRRDH